VGRGPSYFSAGVALAGIVLAVLLRLHENSGALVPLGWAVVGVALVWLIQSVEVLLAVLVLGQFLTHYLIGLLGGEASRNAVFEPALLVFFGSVGIAYLVKADARRRTLSPYEKQSAVLVLAIGALLAAGSFYAPTPATGFAKAIKYAALDAFPFFVVLLGVQSRRELHRLVLLLVVLGTIKCLLTMAGSASEGELGEKGVWLGEGRQFMGFYLNSGIWFGRQVTCALISAIMAFYLVRGSLQKILLWLVVLFLVFAIMLAGSRGPVVGLVASVAILYALLHRGAFTAAALAGASALVLVWAALMIMPSDIQEHFTKGEFADPTGSAQVRMRLYGLGENLFVSHPVWGVGTTGFNYYNIPYEESTEQVLNYVHNIFLEFAADHGLVGLGLICALLRVFWHSCWSCYRHAAFGTDRFYLATWTIAMFAAAFVNAQFSGDVCTNEGIWLAGALGVRLRSLMADEPTTFSRDSELPNRRPARRTRRLAGLRVQPSDML
jgi:hypothetical protein